MIEVAGDTERVHDPVIAQHGGRYYIFSTGGRPGEGVIPMRESEDMRSWKLSGAVFPSLPEWAVKEIPKARGAWAPDISWFNGRYHLYYSVSSFGSRNSAIGLATNLTLDPKSPDYKWVDEGMVLRSFEDRDDWNAIDPNVAIENETSVWLVWGSFWSGIKMKRLDPQTGKLSTSHTAMYSLASRPREKPISGSVEAPFIFRKGNYWYLFVSFDFCCRGAESTYKVAVGRAETITGPYKDRQGRLMIEGGGTTVVEATTQKWRGAGHQAVFTEGGTDYLVFHAYDALTGRSHLRVSTLMWEEGWPRAARLP